jgi:hypothetical protein
MSWHSSTNCVRQPFSVSDIGLRKVIVLTNRINLFWGFSWKAVPHFLDETWREETDFLIGCVDTRAARNNMTRSPACGHCSYALDIGITMSDSGRIARPLSLEFRSALFQAVRFRLIRLNKPVIPLPNSSSELGSGAGVGDAAKSTP